MPLYEYKCNGCGSVFEVLQKFSDEPLTTHEGCGGDVHRLLSAPALQFKGTGWYVTDYAGKRNGNGAKKDGSSEGSKPEAKASSSKDASPSAASSPAAPSTAGKDN